MARILVVDDDPAVRDAVSRLLVRAGHEVDLAENGRVALDRFERAPHDVVVTDINMPEMDGIEVILALHEAHDVPVIVMSAGGKLPAELLLANADALGALAAIPKPFDAGELIAAVEAALRS